MSDSIIIRSGRPQDLPVLLAFDLVAASEPDRAAFLSSALNEGRTLVACDENTCLGYGILGGFFGHAFIELIYVAKSARRGGVGRRIMDALAECVEGDRVFVSTNRSNAPMHALLAELGYVPSGEVRNLDPGDPELFYVKSMSDAFSPE